jgi:hypothetical protein
LEVATVATLPCGSQGESDHRSWNLVRLTLRIRCQLRSIKIGKLRRVTEQHLAEFIASLEDNAA